MAIYRIPPAMKDDVVGLFSEVAALIGHHTPYRVNLVSVEQEQDGSLVTWHLAIEVTKPGGQVLSLAVRLSDYRIPRRFDESESDEIIADRRHHLARKLARSIYDQAIA